MLKIKALFRYYVWVLLSDLEDADCQKTGIMYAPFDIALILSYAIQKHNLIAASTSICYNLKQVCLFGVFVPLDFSLI